MKGIQVYTSARHFTLTGEHPMQHWGRLPGPRNWVPIMIGVLSLICFPFWLGGLPLMLGTMINWIFGLGNDDPERLAVLARIWGTFAILVAVSLTWVQSYNMLEKVQTTIVGLLLFSLLAACLATRPDWISALLGSIIPTVPVYEDWIVSDPKFSAIAARPPWVELAVYIGAIGGGSYDYIGYIGFLREKKWGAMGLASQDGTVEISTDANNIARARKWLIAPKVDTGISFCLRFHIYALLCGACGGRPASQTPRARRTRIAISPGHVSYTLSQVVRLYLPGGYLHGVLGHDLRCL